MGSAGPAQTWWMSHAEQDAACSSRGLLEDRDWADLSIEGRVGVAELAQVEQRLDHRLLQGLLGFRNGELVPVDAAWVVLLVCCLQAPTACVSKSLVIDKSHHAGSDPARKP